MVKIDGKPDRTVRGGAIGHLRGVRTGFGAPERGPARALRLDIRTPPAELVATGEALAAHPAVAFARAVTVPSTPTPRARR
ncbi:hypothetical protein SAMN06272775_3370 [Streptomyces sp. 2323.1]|uniref:hypothetical protein n=1 Tax=Streptomyces sp. 2323.1 TaxID=1938841 RepID=UPI000BB9AC3D|nr:hypothetical protein [Streptomyces sp. 2323.1]SOE12374.1 hypothetical protein SAMN06272775_3370 [Streptomyces sp. 2323.1]